MEDFCQICGLIAHGNHFGVISCRACAAFFRRTANRSKSIYKCKMQNECAIWKNGRYNCKKCRLDRCEQVGMDPSKFQFDRDPIWTKQQKSEVVQFTYNLPETVEQFLGRPHFILFMEPSSNTFTQKSFIDCHNLIDKASKLLRLGSEKPIVARNNLEKLTMGLRLVRENQIAGDQIQVLTKLGKEETFSVWEQDFLAVTKWLTYFDDFQLLPHEQQVELLKTIWQVWGRIDKLVLTAAKRRENVFVGKTMMFAHNAVMDITRVDFDISWFTRYKKEQLIYFLDTLEDWMLVDVLDAMCRLGPSDVEVTYMMCQLCFHYAGKRLQGEMLIVLERFQDTLADNLHDYYVTELNMPRYSGRLNQMLKINNMIQKDTWEKRAKFELAKFFDIWSIEFSHPEMFQQDITRNS